MSPMSAPLQEFPPKVNTSEKSAAVISATPLPTIGLICKSSTYILLTSAPPTYMTPTWTVVAPSGTIANTSRGDQEFKDPSVDVTSNGWASIPIHDHPSPKYFANITASPEAAVVVGLPTIT